MIPFKDRLSKISLILVGFFSLVWFLIRVIPKPSRATYPCQKAAFPFASAFVIWLMSVFTSIKLFKRSKVAFAQSKRWVGVSMFSVAVLCFVFSFFMQPVNDAVANVAEAVKAASFDPSLVEQVELKELTDPVIDTLLSKVSIVKSTRSTADDVSYAELEVMIREAIALSGGLESIVTNGDVVVLKPNLVMSNSKTKEETFYGQTTHNWTLEIVAKIVRELNPTGTIKVMENSYTSTRANFEYFEYDKIQYIDGYYALDEISGGWLEYDSDKLVAISLPDSLSLYPDSFKPNKSREIYINKEYFDADVIISLPTLKNHRSAGITGGVKNVSIGCSPGNIYGENGGTNTNDRSYGIDHDDETTNKLHWWIHDFYMCRGVDFVLMDAMEGLDKGPGGCADCQKNMRLILASNDAVAVDVIEGLLMQQDPAKVNYLVHLHNHDRGIGDPALIEVVGEDVSSNRVKFNPANNRPQCEYSQFTKTTISGYSVNWSVSNNTLTLSVNHLDNDLSRITVKYGDKKKYVVGSFFNVDIDMSDNGAPVTDFELIFEDKYLNMKSKKYQVSNTLINDEKVELSVYPNPATDNVTIELSNVIDNPQLRIIDVSGSVVRQHQGISNNQINMDVSDLPRGIYIVELRGRNSELFKTKLIKK